MTRSARRLGLLFLAVIVPTAATLIWLGLRLLDQDRTLLAQQLVERRQQQADTAVLVLRERLDKSLDEPLPESVRFRLGPRSITPEDGRRILWLPVVPVQPPDSSAQFSELEAREYGGQTAEVLAGYLELAQSPNRATVAGALQRVARIYRRLRQWDQALATYRRMAAFPDIWVNELEMPADLVARRASCDVLEEAGRSRELANTAAALASDFEAGRWTIDRNGWELARRNIERWAGRPVSVSDNARTFAAVAETLWRDWTDGQWRTLRGVRRRVIRVDEVLVTVVERQDERGAVASVLLPEAVRTVLTALAPGDPLGVLNGEQLVAGSGVTSNRNVVRRPAGETGLPWTVAVSVGDESRAARDLAERGRLLLWGLAAIVFLLAGGSYLLWRVVKRELAVARLQTEFVAAVSHEFRTPLASLRHVTELLDENDELPGGERRRFYQVLGRNTERLNRLVESLLDFSRMESGRKPYELRRVDARGLAARVAKEFGAEVAPRGYRVELDAEDDRALMVEADPESLAHALWNLLDNAVKYSPDWHDVVLSVRAHREGVAFAVTDHGLGVPASERAEIFERFVRGARAKELGIRGTGLGLAMVRHIAEAHRGRVEVESQEGSGSTFRVVLPAAA